ncbi:MAG: threonine synthase [Acidobacteria bacterium]|nr:threonine synthase [Acidobacteriota bacterium]
MSDSNPAIRINPNIARIVCSLSGDEQDPEGFRRPLGLCSCCPAPGKPLVVEYDLGTVRERVGDECWEESDGIWRYGALLPIIGLPPRYAADVGGTPIVLHEPLSEETGVELHLKDEGANPSGSFKDRGLAVGVALGAACGAQRFCLPTQGNAGVAASLFSARLGLPGCLVYMPEGYQGNIYHREAEFFDAEVRFAGSNIAASGRMMREAFASELERGDFVDLSTFFEPGRLEGKKTMGLEIADVLGPDELPDWILYPTGGGTGLVGIWKAFQELIGLGRLDRDRHRLPRMVVVQSENCSPVVQAFERGLDHVEPIESKGTVADGLDVPGAIMGHGILSAVRDSGGTAVAVSETSIVEAFRDCGRHGLAVSYESAATLAALRKLRADGVIEGSDRVLLLLTATHLIPLAQAGP